MQVRVRVMIITSTNKIEPCGLSHYVQLVKKTHRLICILTFFDQNLTLRSRDLWPNFDFDLSGPTSTCFDASRRKKHDGVRIMALTFFFPKVFMKNCMSTSCRGPELIGQQLT